jgi:hypothetical protein
MTVRQFSIISTKINVWPLANWWTTSFGWKREIKKTEIERKKTERETERETDRDRKRDRERERKTEKQKQRLGERRDKDECL